MSDEPDFTTVVLFTVAAALLGLAAYVYVIRPEHLPL